MRITGEISMPPRLGRKLRIGASAGSVKVLPPTLTLQWFILGEGFFSPYELKDIR